MILTHEFYLKQSIYSYCVLLPEYQKGWWKVSDQEQLRQLQKCLHPRGIREKNLQKTIQKFSEYTTMSCTKGKKEGKTLNNEGKMIMTSTHHMLDCQLWESVLRYPVSIHQFQYQDYYFSFEILYD